MHSEGCQPSSAVYTHRSISHFQRSATPDQVRRKAKSRCSSTQCGSSSRQTLMVANRVGKRLFVIHVLTQNILQAGTSMIAGYIRPPHSKIVSTSSVLFGGPHSTTCNCISCCSGCVIDAVLAMNRWRQASNKQSSNKNRFEHEVLLRFCRCCCRRCCCCCLLFLATDAASWQLLSQAVS